MLRTANVAETKRLTQREPFPNVPFNLSSKAIFRSRSVFLRRTAPLASILLSFPELPDVKVIDIGASPIDGDPPYQALRAANKMDLVAFEPDDTQFAALQALNLPRTTAVKAAIGDGTEGILRVCKSPGMTSLLEPDQDVLAHFHGFAEWGTVLSRQPMMTRRLDDIAEVAGAHYLKLDVQGGELPILQHGSKTLKDCLVVHTEVQFVPFYKDQPLFAELDQALRAAGFWLHRFLPIHSRIFKPLMVNNDIYAGMSQDLWTDAVYVRRFTDFPALAVDALQRIALIAHDLYGSYDLASLALLELDKRDGGDRQPRYLRALVANP
jgi:FkbM family methyltransferase